MTTPEPLIRPPLQRRSQESFERVLEAGLEVLVDVGFEGFTLQEVSRRSGVSIGSIYARVDGREALILAIHERAMAGLSKQEERLERDSAAEGLTPRELVETLVYDMAHIMLDNAPMLRVFMRQAPMNPVIWQRGARNSEHAARFFRSAFLAHREQLRHPDPELGVDVAYRMVYCTIARRITHGPQFESAREVTDEELVRELGQAVANYLLGSLGSASTDRAPRKAKRSSRRRASVDGRRQPAG
jgi:AcrR family transcriptional regulator